MKSRRARSLLVERLESRTLLAADFTIVALSDTQYAVEDFPETFRAQTQWMAAHASDPAYNIAFLAHAGDMLRRGYSNYQCGNADEALSTLDGLVPYTVSIGNHDYDNQFDDLDHHISSAGFTSWFGDARYQEIAGSGFGGSSLDQRNRYHLFEAAGQKYMVMSIEWEAPDAAIAWAQGVINAHREIPVILTTHEYLSGGGRTTSPLDPAGNSGESIFQKLVKPNPQIFLVMSGHTGAVYHQTSTNSSSNPDYATVYEAVSDFEKRPNGGDGYFQLFHFFPAQNQISVSSYSATLNQFDTSSSAYQFSMSINFARRFGFANGAVGNDDTFDVIPGHAAAGDVAANDHTSLGGATLTAARLSGPSHGSLSLNADGTFLYTPAAGYHGTDQFVYRVSDGTNTSNAATVRLRVNSTPAGSADAAVIQEGKAITLNVVANDSDTDGDLIRPILKTLPAHGAVFANADGTLTYTPDPRYVGVDEFSYYPCDGTVVGAPVTVSIVVEYGPSIYNYPVSETTTYGTKSGSYVSLAATDGNEEVLYEVLRTGSAVIDHRWLFNVKGGTEVTFCINAKRSRGTDEYHFQYSTNGSNWSDLTQFVPASSKNVTRVQYDVDEPYQMWALPAATAGTVWIRTTDVKSNSDLCFMTIDEMFIRSGVPVGFVAQAGAAFAFSGPSSAQTLAVTAGAVMLKGTFAGSVPNCTLRATGSAVVTMAGEQHLAALELSGGGRANVAGRDVALFSKGLSIAAGSVLDAGEGMLVLPYTAATGIESVRQHILYGRLVATSSEGMTLAQVDNAMIRRAMWGDVAISDGSDFRQVIVQPALPGDANLDGVVDARDYVNIIAGMGRTGAQWMDGDVDHNGVVNVDDLAAVNAHLGGASVGPSLLSVTGATGTTAAPASSPATGSKAMPAKNRVILRKKARKLRWPSR